MPNLPDIEARRDAFDIDAFATEPGDIVAFHTSMLHGGAAVDPRTPERRTLTLRFFGDDVVSTARPGPAGPFYEDIQTLVPGEPFRHPRFLQVRGRGGGGCSLNRRTPLRCRSRARAQDQILAEHGGPW